MKNRLAVFLLFLVASLYDGVLGLLFLFAAAPLYDWAQVTPPNHLGYVQFPAALLIIFGLMFLAVALNPRKNRNLIPYGLLLKISYCSVTFYHWFATDLPWIWKPFAVIDLLFIVAFVWAYKALGESKSTQGEK
jgi:hypothetical protein